MTRKRQKEDSSVRTIGRRDFLRTGAVFGAGAFLCSCSSETGQSPTTQPGGSEEKVIRMWMTRYFNPNITEHLFQEAKRAGEKLGFVVKPEAIVGDFQEYAAKLAAAAEAGTLPDIFASQLSTLKFVKDGRLLPIQDIWEEVGNALGGWHPVAEANFSVDGVGYALDDGLIPAPMHVRQDLVNAAGFRLPFKNMDEMEQCAKAITDPAENLYGCGFSMGRADDLHHLQCYMWAYGGAVQDKQGNITLDTPENAQALERYCNLYKVLKVVPPGAINWNAGGNNQSYLTGQCAMAINPGSLLASIRRGETPIEGLLEKTYMTPTPQAKPEFGPQTQTQAGTGFAISADTKFPEIAKKILLHLWSPDVYLKMMRMGQSYLFPALMGAYEDDYFTKDPWNRQIVENVLPIMHDESRAGPPQPWTMMWSTWAGQAIKRVVVDDWEPRRAMAEAHETVEAAKESFTERY